MQLQVSQAVACQVSLMAIELQLTLALHCTEPQAVDQGAEEDDPVIAAFHLQQRAYRQIIDGMQARALVSYTCSLLSRFSCSALVLL